MNHTERAPRLIPWAQLKRSLGLLAALAAGMVALVAVGPRLPLGPGMTRVSHWATWLADGGPPTAVMSIVRLAGLLVGLYLLAVTALDLVATITRSPILTSLTRHVTLPFARRLIAGVTGAGLAASLSIGIVTPTLATAAPRSLTSTTVVPVGNLAPPNHTMRRADQAAPPSPAPAGDTATIPVRTWTIAPGDHLWKVSSHTLEAAWGRRPHDDETLRYLKRLIDANRYVLVVADDPDLVFPGQIFLLPDVPAP